MIRDTTEEIQAMSKSKLSIRSAGAEESPDVFTTPILPPSETSSHEILMVAATCGERDEDTANVAPPAPAPAPDTVPFPDLTTPSTPKGKFSRVPLNVQVQLQLQQLNFEDKDDGSDDDSQILCEGAVLPIKPRESPDNYPNIRHEQANISFKNIDSFFEDDSALPPIREDGWIIDFPQKKTHFRPIRRSGSPYLQPRKAKLFEEIGDGETHYM